MRPLYRDDPLSLADGQVDVWLCPSTPESCRTKEAYAALISDVERARWQRFLSIDAANQFLVGRALLRTALSHYIDVAPEDWVFETTSYGKPFIAGQGNVSIGFNLAHTSGLVACAIHTTQNIGIDVEAVDRNTDWECLAGVTLVDRERRRLNAESEFERLHMFFRFWTLKEAFIKAKGLGLSIPLSSFAFDLDVEPPRIVFQTACEDRPDRWHFREFVLGGSFRMAVAARLDNVQTLNVTKRWLSPLSAL